MSDLIDDIVGEVPETDEVETQDTEVVEVEEEPTQDAEETVEQEEPEKTDAEKERDGLYAAFKEEKGKRQEMERSYQETKGRLDQLTQTINQVLSERQKPVEKKQEPETPKPVSVDYDEEGNAFVPPDQFQKLIEMEIQKRLGPYQKATEQHDQYLGEMRQRNDAQSRYEAELNAVLSESDEFQESFPKVQRAHDFLNQMLTQSMQNQYGKVFQINGDQALDYLESITGAEDAFKERFPEMSVEETLRAFDSKRGLRKALKMAAPKQKQTDESEKAKTLQKLSQKPKTLGAVPNRKNAEDETFDSIIAALKDADAMDLMNMSDEQARKLDAAARRLEE